jgi:hypothetical protein
MPYTKMIDINSFFPTTIPEDSLIILLDAKSKTGTKYEERFVMNLNKSISTGPKVFRDDDGNYREILLSVNETINEQIIDEIARMSQGTSKVVLEYYNEIAKNSVSILKKSLENKLKKELIVIKSVKYSKINNFSAGIAPQIVKFKLIIE